MLAGPGRATTSTCGVFFTFYSIRAADWTAGNWEIVAAVHS